MTEAFVRDGSLASRFPRCPAARGESCVGLIRFVADRPGHDLRYAIDPRRIEKDLGVRPAIALGDGLKRTIDWYLQNESWWRGAPPGSERG